MYLDGGYELKEDKGGGGSKGEVKDLCYKGGF